MSDVHSTSRFAAERYVLGEMTAEERDVFEDHFFSCPECADHVQAAATFVDSAREVLPQMDQVTARKPKRADSPGWFGWRLAPQGVFACLLVLTGVSGYQNLVEIPRLRSAAATTAELTVTAAEPISARRAASHTVFSSRDGIDTVVVPNEWEENFPKYAVEIQKSENSRAILSSSEVSGAASLVIRIPVSYLGAGKYTIILYGVSTTGQKQAIVRYPISVT